MPSGENLKDVDLVAAGRKGGKARAAKIAEQKAKDAAAIEEAWRKRLKTMDSRLDEIIANVEKDGATALRAILAGQDRLAGRPTQHTELSGGIEVTVDAHARVADLLARRAPRKRKGGADQ